ncbi:MAG: methyltransferase domain-containing protein [Ilumatobacteraceae bacterium]
MTQDSRVDDRGTRADVRFGALAAVFDPITFRHLDAIGVGVGWRCWEVGAGGPSVPCWLAERVGPSGAVLATDVDVAGIPLDDVFAVRRHDVVHDEPPGDDFDLVHARMVLTHVAAQREALARMARSLRPGGWMVVEDVDVDFQPWATPDARAPEHYLANRIRAGCQALQGEAGMDLELGRKLPRMLRDTGLVDVSADAYFPLALPCGADLERANSAPVRDDLVELRAATHDELDEHLAAAAAGRVDIAMPPLVSVWGRRPSDR